MLAVAVVGLWAAGLCTVYGLLSLRVLAWAGRVEVCHRAPLPIVWVVGACALAVATSYLSLVMPIGAAANGLVLAGAAGGAAWLRGELAERVVGAWAATREAPRLGWALLGLVGVAVLGAATAAVPSYDTGLYHAQAVAWIEDRPVVPGLANLNDALGQHSSWFPLLALFRLSFLGLGPFHGFNGIFQLFVAATAVGALGRLVRGRPTAADLFAVLLLVPWLGRRNEFPSQGADLAAAQITFVCFWLFLRRRGSGASSFDLTAALLFVLPIVALTVKLSAAPTVVLSLYVLLRHPRALAPLALVAGAILLPWLIRTWVLSGYLVYPLTATGFLAPDWQLPPEFVATAERAVRGQSRVRGPEPEQALGMGLAEWVPIWFEQQRTDDRLVLIGTAALTLARAPSLRRPTWTWDAALPHALAYGGLAFWFLTAPEFRFALGYWWSLGALLALPMVARALRRFGPAAAYALLALLIAYAGREAVFRVDWVGVRRHVLLPASYPAAALRPVQVGPVVVYESDPRPAPTGDVQDLITGQCWDAPRPCARRVVPGLQPRGPSLSEGFNLARTEARPN